MNRNRFDRRGVSIHPDPRIGRMILFSLGLHLVVVLIFSGLIVPRFHREKPPVYYVDLVNLPVKNPQAGRPDSSPAEPKPAPKIPEAAKTPEAVLPPVPAKPEPKPAPAAKKAPPPKPEPKPAPKPVAKPVAKPAPKAKYEEALSAIEKMRREQEREALKQKLAALQANDPRKAASAAEAPVGMPTGKGHEAGVDESLYIQTFLKKNWSLSKYQVMRQDLEATVTLTFDAEGNLINYKFREKSGDQTFDESVKMAILKSKQLPFKPGRRLEIDEVVFNLKDLLE